MAAPDGAYSTATANREEAARAREIALVKMEEKDWEGAKRIWLKAQRLCPDLDGIASGIAVAEVHIVANATVYTSPYKEVTRDYYGILDVKPDATRPALMQQYKKRALQLHPDKNQYPGAEAAFKILGEAWDILRDEQKRLKYDRQRTARQAAQNLRRNGQQQANPGQNRGPYAQTFGGQTWLPNFFAGAGGFAQAQGAPQPGYPVNGNAGTVPLGRQQMPFGANQAGGAQQRPTSASQYAQRPQAATAAPQQTCGSAGPGGVQSGSNQPGAYARQAGQPGSFAQQPGANQRVPGGQSAATASQQTRVNGGQPGVQTGQPRVYSSQQGVPAGQPRAYVGQMGAYINQQAAQTGQPRVCRGVTVAQAGGQTGLPREHFNVSGVPTSQPHWVSAQQQGASASQPQVYAGQPGAQASQNRGYTEHYGATASGTRAFASQPGVSASQPGVQNGQPRAYAGAPGSQPRAYAGQPGAYVSQQGVPTSQPGAYAAPGAAAPFPTQPSGARGIPPGTNTAFQPSGQQPGGSFSGPIAPPPGRFVCKCTSCFQRYTFPVSSKDKYVRCQKCRAPFMAMEELPGGGTPAPRPSAPPPSQAAPQAPPVALAPARVPAPVPIPASVPVPVPAQVVRPATPAPQPQPQAEPRTVVQQAWAEAVKIRTDHEKEKRREERKLRKQEKAEREQELERLRAAKQRKVEEKARRHRERKDREESERRRSASRQVDEESRAKVVAEGEQIPLRPVTRPVTVESTDVAGANGIGVNGLAGGVNGLGGNVNGLGGVGEDSEDEPLVRKRKAKPETEPVEADGTGNGVPERGGGAGPTGRDPEDEPIRRGKLRKVAERKGGERPDDIFKREINEANGVKGVPGKGNEDGPAARSVGGKRKAEVSGSGRGDDAGAGLRLGLGGGFWVGLETASGAGRVLDLGFGTAGNDPKAGIQGTGIGVDASEAGMVQSEDEQRKRRKVNVVDLTTSEEETAEGETETEAEAKRRAEKGKAKVEQETEIEERGTTQTETEPEGGGTGEEEGGTGRTETELGLTGQTETESERGGTTETEPEPEQGGMGQTETEAEMRRRVVADDDPREVLAGRGKRKMRRLVDVLKIATAEEVLFEEAPRVGPREPPFLRPAKAAPAVKKPVGGKAAAKEKKPLGEKVIPDLEVPRDEKEIPSQTLNEGVGPSGTNANSAEALQGEAARSVGEDSHQAPTEPGPSGVNGHSPTESEDGVWSTPDSVFFDFDEVRKESDVLPGHYWALYDETDGMPRFYGRIDAVCANPFQVNLTWLEATEENRAAFYGRHPPLGAQSPKISPGTGEFKFGKTAQFDSINIFAYRQTAIQPLDGGAKLFPRCAEVWAMFDVERGAKRDRGGKEKAALQYELVEIVGIDGGYTVTKLMRLPRHPTLFQPVRGPNGRPLKVSVKPADVPLFSHRVLGKRVPKNLIEVSGTSRNVDVWELDPAALPV